MRDWIGDLIFGRDLEDMAVRVFFLQIGVLAAPFVLLFGLICFLAGRCK